MAARRGELPVELITPTSA